jgi:stage II sporulation protein D
VTIEPEGFGPVEVDFPVEVIPEADGLVIVVSLPLEEYVVAVLAGEALGFESAESLKAMAVAVRTYAVHFDGRHSAEGVDFCDTTHCQDFRISAVDNRLRDAVEETAGEVLLYQEDPIPAYYHQDCGGRPEPAAPYLRVLEDSFCTSEDHRPWIGELSAADIGAAIGGSTGVDNVTSIEVVARTPSGRAERLEIRGSETTTIAASEFRLAAGRTLGWERIPSDLYTVRRSADRFVFEGYGAGHGLGLCQRGAAIMGRQGHSYLEILRYYYPGTTLLRLRDLPARREINEAGSEAIVR